MSDLHPLVLISGDDTGLVAEAIRTAVAQSLGDEDRALALEEFTEDDYRTENGFEINRLVDAAQTGPFLTGRRVVVGRHLGRFSDKASVAPLVEYLASPMDTTFLIAVWEKGVAPAQQRLGQVPKSLLEAISNAGGEFRRVAVGRGREAVRWLDERLDEAPVQLDRSARVLVVSRLGEDRASVVPLLETLEAVFGSESLISADDVAPFMGNGGNVAPWDLTDAIDGGRVPEAIDCLTRMINAGNRHPLAVIAGLQGHYGRLLRLDGSGIQSDTEAAEILGIKGFPAKKALQATRKLGGAQISRAIGLLADADLDLRGRSAWPPELVAEVLVARLASLSRS